MDDVRISRFRVSNSRAAGQDRNHEKQLAKWFSLSHSLHRKRLRGGCRLAVGPICRLRGPREAAVCLHCDDGKQKASSAFLFFPFRIYLTTTAQLPSRASPLLALEAG